jgi:hypothetical protein
MARACSLSPAISSNRSFTSSCKSPLPACPDRGRRLNMPSRTTAARPRWPQAWRCVLGSRRNAGRWASSKFTRGRLPGAHGPDVVVVLTCRAGWRRPVDPWLDRSFATPMRSATYESARSLASSHGSIHIEGVKTFVPRVYLGGRHAATGMTLELPPHCWLSSRALGRLTVDEAGAAKLRWLSGG